MAKETLGADESVPAPERRFGLLRRAPRAIALGSMALAAVEMAVAVRLGSVPGVVVGWVGYCAAGLGVLATGENPGPVTPPEGADTMPPVYQG